VPWGGSLITGHTWVWCRRPVTRPRVQPMRSSPMSAPGSRRTDGRKGLDACQEPVRVRERGSRSAACTCGPGVTTAMSSRRALYVPSRGRARRGCVVQRPRMARCGPGSGRFRACPRCVARRDHVDTGGEIASAVEPVRPIPRDVLAVAVTKSIPARRGGQAGPAPRRGGRLPIMSPIIRTRHAPADAALPLAGARNVRPASGAGRARGPPRSCPGLLFGVLHGARLADDVTLIAGYVSDSHLADDVARETHRGEVVDLLRRTRMRPRDRLDAKSARHREAVGSLESSRRLTYVSDDSPRAPAGGADRIATWTSGLHARVLHSDGGPMLFTTFIGSCGLGDLRPIAACGPPPRGRRPCPCRGGGRPSCDLDVRADLGRDDARAARFDDVVEQFWP